MEIKQAKLFKKQARMMQKRGVNMLELRAAVEAIVENNHDKLVKNERSCTKRTVDRRP